MTSIEVSKELVERLLAGPDLYPYRLALPDNCIDFRNMNRACYGSSPFLDHRIVSVDDAYVRLPFRAVPALCERLESRATHYIFHNAFACSTLLTRYLDALQGVMVLREPNSLYEVITVQRFAGMPMARPLEQVDWQTLFTCIVRLLGRRYQSATPVVIKPTDACNSHMLQLLDMHQDNRAVFIYTPLKRFLASVLRHPPRHEWVKVRLRELLIDDFRRTGTLLVNPEQLDVAQSTALVWLLHTDAYMRVHANGGDTRFAALPADAFMDSPERAVLAVARHFGYGFDAETVAAALAGVKTDSHAKAANESYDAAARERDYEQARERFDSEIQRAIVWLDGYRRGRDIEAPLPASVLDA